MQEMQKTWVWCVGWEDPLEEEMATHSSVLVWKIQWREESGRLQSMEPQRDAPNWTTEHTPKMLSFQHAVNINSINEVFCIHFYTKSSKSSMYAKHNTSNQSHFKYPTVTGGSPCTRQHRSGACNLIEGNTTHRKERLKLSTGDGAPSHFTYKTQI